MHPEKVFTERVTQTYDHGLTHHWSTKIRTTEWALTYNESISRNRNRAHRSVNKIIIF